MTADFTLRSTEQELMDYTEVSPDMLVSVLKDINRVNKILGGNAITKKALLDFMLCHPKEHYTIIDVGSGDGTMLREIALMLRKKKVAANFIGIDINKISIEIAREQSTLFPEIKYLQKDILSGECDTFPCDILLCTLTMHHFSTEQIPAFLNKFTQIASIGVVINDLQRSKWAYLLFQWFSAIFIKTNIAKSDGLISIKKGFVKSELTNYSKTVVNATHHIQWKWAFRYVWLMNLNTKKF